MICFCFVGFLGGALGALNCFKCFLRVFLVLRVLDGFVRFSKNFLVVFRFKCFFFCFFCCFLGFCFCDFLGDFLGCFYGFQGFPADQYFILKGFESGCCWCLIDLFVVLRFFQAKDKNLLTTS